MAEYFEPVSVLGLGRVLGLGHRRGRHAAAVVPRARAGCDQLRGRPGEMGDLRRDRSGDRPRARAGARAAVGRARREHDLDDAPARRGRLRGARGAHPAHAQGDPARRHAGARARRRLHARRAARVGPGCRSRRRDPCGPRPGRGRGGPALGLADRDADAALPWSTSELDGVDLPSRRQPGPARVVREPRRGGVGADGGRASTCSGRGATMPRSASVRTSARVTTSRACRCGSRIQRLFERLPSLRLDPDRPPVFSGWEFRAPQHLHVIWDA